MGWSRAASRSSRAKNCPPQPRPRPSRDFMRRQARLIVQRASRQPAALKRAKRRLVRDLECVEAAAEHQRNFIEQHFADRAELALEAQALTQQLREREGASVGEFRKVQRD